MAEHKFAQVLRWLADGKRVQVNVGGWTTCSDEGVFRHIMNNALNSREMFRLEPMPIKIGDSEIDPPEKRPVEAGMYYYWCSDSQKPAPIKYKRDEEWCVRAAAHGQLFKSYESCRAAHAAIARLLTQNPEAA